MNFLRHYTRKNTKTKIKVTTANHKLNANQKTLSVFFSLLFVHILRKIS